MYGVVDLNDMILLKILTRLKEKELEADVKNIEEEYKLLLKEADAKNKSK